MDTGIASSPDHDMLYQIAETQAGYFTTGQATTARFSHALLSHHTRTGLFERICPGVYRLRRFPASAHEDLYIAWLRVGMRAVISHGSALALYELSDLMPDEVHLTVPRTVSRRHPGIRLHTNRLNAEEVTRYWGLPVTTVARAIVDVASSGLSQELVEQAIAEALRRGLTTTNDLRQIASRRKGRAEQIVEHVLQTASES